MTVHPGGDVEAWRSFLLLLGRSPEAVRADGGIARVWTTMAGRHVEMREIDYAEVLRERDGRRVGRVGQGRSRTACRAGAFELDEEAIRELLDIAGDSEQLAELMATLETAPARTAASARRPPRSCACSAAFIDAVTEGEPEQLEPVLQQHGDGGRPAARRRCCMGLLAEDAAEAGRRRAAADGRRRQPDVRRDDRAVRVAAT